MADGSSPSLDLSQLVDPEYTADTRKEKQNFALGQFVTDMETEELGKLSAAASWSRKYNPDAYAEAAKLLPGVPAETALRQLPYAQRSAAVDKFNEVFAKAPSLRTHFTRQPKDLAYANPDELDQLSGINWAINAAPAAFSAGNADLDAGLRAYNVMAGVGSIEDQAFLNNYTPNDRTFGNQGDWLSSGLVGAAQSLPSMVSVLFNSVYRGTQGAAVGAVAGAAVGAPFAGVGAAPGAAGGASVGFQTGAAYGGLERNIQIQSGLNYLEFRNFKDENGQPLDPTLAKWAALLSGIGSGGLEQLGLAKTLGKVPGVDQIMGLVGKEGMKKALRNPTMRSALTTFAKNLGEAVTVETLTEMGQEGMAILGGELAKSVSEQEFQQLTAAEAAQRVGEAGVAALQVMTLMGPITSGTRFAGDIIQMSKDQRSNRQLKIIGEQLMENKFVQRAPEVARQVIDEQTQGQKLYLPAKEMLELYQSRGEDVYGPALPNWRQRFDEALAAGDDVEVSVGEFFTALGQDPKTNPLYTLVKSDPSSFIPKDMEEYQEALDDLMKSDLEKANDQVVYVKQAQEGTLPPPPDTRVKDMLAEQIKATGFKPDAANHYATVLGAYMNVKAKQLDMDPVEFLQTYGPEIMRIEALGATIHEMKDGPQSLNDAMNQTLVDPRGSIQFRAEAPPVINLFGQADMTTLLHESGHFFLQTTKDLAERSPEIAADWNIIKKQLKIGDDGVITREQHEEFAKLTEAYFMEGKAPSAELRSAFQAFRQWLKAIYKSIIRLGGSVNPEIRAVFDNMLRTERKIDELAQDQGYKPLFTDAAEMGVDPADYLEYQNLVEDLRIQAQDGVVGRVVGQQKKLQTGWRKEVENQLAAEAEEKLKLLAPYKHAEIMKTPQFSINTEMFAKQFSKAAAKSFPRAAFNKTGLDPEVAANILGYPSADEMVYDFTQALPLKEAARQAAQAEMVVRYGQDYQNQEILDLAVKRALSEDGRVVVLAKEYKALSAKAGREVSENSPRQLAAEIARRSLYTKRFRDVNERKTLAAVKRSATMAERAMLKGKWSEAADWKRKQLLAQAIATETQRLNEAIGKIRDKAARHTRTTSKTIDPSTMEQIRALVTQYEFAKVPLKQLNKRQSLAEYVQAAEAEGLVTKVPDYLLRKLDRQNFKELTVEELFGLGDTLDNLEHIGRLKHKLRTAKGNREFAEVRTEMLTSIRQRPTKPVKMKTYTEKESTAMMKVKAWGGALIKAERIVQWLDLDNIAGPMMEYLFQPIADAQNKQNDLMVEYADKIMKAFDKIPSDHLTQVFPIKSLNTNMTMQAIYATALNLGNDSNRAKLMQGELWSEQQVAEIISHLKKEDWDRIQKIWDILESLWPKVSAMEKRLTGVAPPRVEPREITNIHGTYRGGYYPVIYDFNARRGLALIEDVEPQDWKIDTKNLFANNRHIKPGTNHTHTYARTKVAKPIKLELAVLPGEIQKVIHDLAYREPVRGAVKVLSDPDIKQAIIDTEGDYAFDQLSYWLQNVATEYSAESNPQIRWMERVRIGTTIFGMGFRVTTALAQPLGWFNSMIEVNKGHLASAIWRVSVNPYQTLDVINNLSGEMRHRFNQQDRDIRDFTQVLTKDTNKVVDFTRQYAFWMIGFMDKYVASTTWLGAYNQYLEEHPNDSDLAVRHADRVVRLTQGTGSAKDMAKVMDKAGVMSLFTSFYSAFSAIYNMQVDLTRRTKRDIAEGDWHTLLTQRLPQWCYFAVFPAIFGALLSGQGPEDDEDAAWWALKKTMLYPFAGVPFVRDIVGAAASGFDYKLSPQGKIYEDTAKGLSALFNSDNSFAERVGGAVKPLLSAASIGLHLPTGQAINTVEALWKGLEEGDLEFQDLIYGRRGK